jgi:hypothetical protein
VQRRPLVTLVLLGALAAAPAGAAAEPLSGRAVRCLALVAFTEAAVDGREGMAAVIRVVRNRMADPRFPSDACAVVAQVAQFQPIAQSAVLRQVVRDLEGYSIPRVLGLRSPAARRLLVLAHELARAPMVRRDPTGGALYFVNPDLMEPERCPWFAALKRTAAIGRHVFMTHYRAGEPAGPPALDCATAGAGRAGGRPLGRAGTALRALRWRRGRGCGRRASRRGRSRPRAAGGCGRSRASRATA